MPRLTHPAPEVTTGSPLDEIERLERENAELCAELASLQEQHKLLASTVEDCLARLYIVRDALPSGWSL